MAVDFPRNAQEVVNRLKADVQNELPTANPFLKNSLLNALVTAYGYRNFDVYKLVQEQQKQFFPQTATGKFLDYFATLQDIEQTLPTSSSGNVVFSGSTAGTLIPLGTSLSFSSLTFTTLAECVLSANSVAVSQITQTGGTATITFANNHGLATGVQITIAGAAQSSYNGTHTVTVTNVLEATYTVDAATTSPATTATTITASFNVATVKVQCSESGSNTNVSSGGKLSLQTTISGVNNNAYVSLNSLSGGADQETTDNYRLRVIDAWQNPVAQFNEEAIRRQALKISGVTRVFVMRSTKSTTTGVYNKDDAGFVTVYFVKDNENTIIPDGTAISDVKASIMSIAPMTTVSANVFVEAPLAVQVNVTFTSISPDTTTMRTSIQENLRQFFRASNDMNGVNTGTETNGTITLNDINFAILQTVDSTTGKSLQDYTISTPVANIVPNDGEITTLGTVTFI